MYAYAREAIRAHREPLHAELVYEATSCDVLRVTNRLFKLNAVGYSATILAGFFYIETLRDRLIEDEKDKLLLKVFGRKRMEEFDAAAKERDGGESEHPTSPLTVVCDL